MYFLINFLFFQYKFCTHYCIIISSFDHKKNFQGMYEKFSQNLHHHHYRKFDILKYPNINIFKKLLNWRDRSDFRLKNTSKVIYNL